ncbi:methionine--tRNA ligase [Devosia neptuniae]|uniref:methionine--tRNA ligase n=1 Tax=Devosia neptuniae TaxID=191302 RepID=UPI0022AF20BC|nr:methionine--tRNA ligase [Devosia neptuniae]MCZ4345051.1 methionine--tRNA ligase [Devosia neptuniae]|tara:strand:+ start:9156 stop:10706 length:1551 start_codon:yes stop_codon:yes gene_type:complete
MTSKPFYVTTAISYPNGVPHIGHAYEMIATDAIARFKRLEGREVYFLTGTDEHGIKMVQTAAAQDITPRELADRNAAEFKKLAGELNVSNDDFIRTTEERHHQSSQAIWQKMAASHNGDIFQSTYKGWYSVRDEAYFDEDELTEKDGKRFAPSGAQVEWVEEPTYFFRLSAYQGKLLALYEANPDFIAPKERRNEIISFVKGGLKDLSISRTTFDWGIPVPDAPGHVMYVWVDALTNYISGLGFPDEAAELFKKFWPADLHVIGKDIIRFHTVYWPAFLMSAGIDVPHRVFAHGFLTVDGQKMSKSLGNVIDPFALIEEFGPDALRYFLLREVSFGQDGDYSRDKLVNRVNADLANNLGNLAQRSLSMINKNCDAKVPSFGDMTPADLELIQEVDAAIEQARKAMDEQLVHEASGAIVAALSSANNYFAGQEPWALKKTDPERMATVLYVTADTVRRLTIPMLAFVPASAARLLDQLMVPQGERLLAHALEHNKLQPGTELPAPQGVFARIERKAD